MMNPKSGESQPQILRLRSPQNTRQTSLRMTDWVMMTNRLMRLTDHSFSEFQIEDARPC
jgi:hypothetical protein